VTDWLLEGMIPAGAIVVLLDDDDEIDPQAAIKGGADVVIYLHSADPETLNGRPFLFEVRWRDGLVPGRCPPVPVWCRWTGRGFVRVEEWAA
jgi:hypothetical protein